METFYSREFIINKEKHFIRCRKMLYTDYIKFIFWNKGRNNNIEGTEFFKQFMDKKFETISQQALGKQRKFILPELFIKIYKTFVDTIYSEHKHFSTVKGYIIAACDGSIFDLPNITLTRRDFNIPDDTIFEKHRIRARVSGMLDVNSGFILTTKIVERTVSEIELAMEHLLDLKKRLNIEKFIAVYDRAYNSIELMTFTDSLNSKFVIRLQKTTFKNEIRKIKGSDKIIAINLKDSIIKNFENEELKEYARKIGRLELRVVEIKLANGTVELLVTNLDKEEFSLEEMKEIYAKRWNIETGFKKLKSQVQIEHFSGYSRIIIEQDFYAKIFLYNLATAIQWDGQNKLSINKRNIDDEYIYKPCFSTIVGIMFIYLDDILSSKRNLVSDVVDFLIERASKLYYQKSLSLLKFYKLIKILNDLALQLNYGKDWEKNKPKRSPKDPSNDNPGNPKPTH